MLNKINRKLLVSKKNREMGKQEFEIALRYIELSGQTDDMNERLDCAKAAANRMKLAAMYLGFKDVESMAKYFNKHGEF